MKPRFVVLIIVALVCAGGAAFMVLKLLSGPRDADTVFVLVAKEDLKQSQSFKGVVKEEKDGSGNPVLGQDGKPKKVFNEDNPYFTRRQYVRGQEPKNALNEVELEGRILNQSRLSKGQFCTEDDLLPKAQQIDIPTTMLISHILPGGGGAAWKDAVNKYPSLASLFTDFGSDVANWKDAVNKWKGMKAQERDDYRTNFAIAWEGWNSKADKEKQAYRKNIADAWKRKTDLEKQGMTEAQKQAYLKDFAAGWADYEKNVAEDPAAEAVYQEISVKQRFIALGAGVTRDNAVGVFLLPGKHVDVVYAEQVANKKPSTKILFDVEVLGVDNLSKKPDDKQTIEARTITMALTPEDAERLTLAMEKGSAVRYSLLSDEDWGPKKALERKIKNKVVTTGDTQGEPKKVMVWVAKDDIKQGEPLTIRMFEQKEFLQNEKPEKAITDFSSLEDPKLNKPLAKGKFLTAYHLEGKQPVNDPPVETVPTLEIVNGRQPPVILRFFKENGGAGVLDGSQRGRGAPERLPTLPEKSVDWKPFGSKDGRFSVQMPGDPDPDRQRLTEGEEPSYRHTFTSGNETGGRYQVAYNDVPALRYDWEAQCKQILEEDLKDAKDKNAEDVKSSKVGDYPAYEYKILLKDGKSVRWNKIILVKLPYDTQRLYQLRVWGDEAKLNIPRFWGSFAYEK